MNWTKSNALSTSVTRSVVIHRNNLISVCRCAVKTLIDKSCYEVVDETDKDVINICSIIEHILSFRLRPYQTWYGAYDQKTFWDFIVSACHHVPNTCLGSVQAMEVPMSAAGKGRAWLRLALIEKKLADYLGFAFEQPEVCSRYYMEGSVVRWEQASALPAMLHELSSIDFSFDLKGEDLDVVGLPVIDYTPFLKFEQSMEEGCAAFELTESPSSDCLGPQPDEEKYRLACQQKGYLEVLLQKRDAELAESRRQRALLVEAAERTQRATVDDRKQLESVILELQAQMSLQSEDYARRLHHAQTTLHRSLPVFTMSDLMSLELKADATEETLPEEETEERKADKEQTQSLRALAGSFTPSNEITSAPCAAEPLPCD